MSLFLFKRLLLVFLIFFSSNLFGADKEIILASDKFPPDSSYFINEKDTSVAVFKHNIKICSCQVLAFQTSTYHRQKNFALFAEKSNGRSLTYDMSRINRVMEKEKKHMQSFFYDKLTVLNSFTEHTDCKSLYTKLKSKNKFLILYDILDADIRR
jgi:hypothetical protein